MALTPLPLASREQGPRRIATTPLIRPLREHVSKISSMFCSIVLSQISSTGNLRASTYFNRKVSEGKSKAQALVCLRRQMVTIIWMMLKHRTEYRLPA
jgi:hypothetical protein